MNGQRSERAGGARVLIVEDVVLRAMELDDVLTDRGCDVVGYAHDVRSALTGVRRGRPDVALVSLGLGDPERHGDTVALLARLGIDCVLLTEGDPAEAAAWPVAACLHRPCNDDAVSAAVAAVRRRRSDALDVRRRVPAARAMHDAGGAGS